MVANTAHGADPAAPPDPHTLPPPVELTAQQDHQRLMALLHIMTLRPGADGMNRQVPNYANYDEARANPYPSLPDPLILKNERKVTMARIWWRQRRPQIVEDFDREVYGRVPKRTSGVKWEVTATTRELNGYVAFRQHSGGHTPAPNWPTFLTFADRYIKVRPVSNTDVTTNSHS